MDSTKKQSELLPMAGLLRIASLLYIHAVREALASEGLTDLSQNACIALCAIAYGERPLSVLARQFGTSKQAAGQLIDTLVSRDYLERYTNITDRRRLTIRPTRKGQKAAMIAKSAIAETDALLEKELGTERFADLYANLIKITALEIQK